MKMTCFIFLKPLSGCHVEMDCSRVSGSREMFRGNCRHTSDGGGLDQHDGDEKE